MLNVHCKNFCIERLLWAKVPFALWKVKENFKRIGGVFPFIIHSRTEEILLCLCFLFL